MKKYIFFFVVFVLLSGGLSAQVIKPELKFLYGIGDK